MKKVFPLLLLPLLWQCRSEKATVKPDVDRFFQVYQELTALITADSLGTVERSALLDSALRRNGMTLVQFDTTLAFLQRNPQVLIDRLEAMEKKNLSPVNP